MRPTAKQGAPTAGTDSGRARSGPQQFRPGRPAIAATNFSLARATRGRAGKLEYAGEVPAVGPGPQTYALRYVIQLADPRTCKQVRELRGLYPISTATSAGWEDVLASPGLWWDGRDDRGRPVHSQALFVRGWLSVDLAGLDLLPPLPPAETEPRGPVPIDPDPPIPIDPAPVIDRSVIPGPELARFRLGNAWMAIQALINRPHPDYVGNVFACGRETPSAPIEALPSCAPSADWHLFPAFRATRSIPIVCGACGMTTPPPAEISRRWQVRFRQGADWLIGFSLPVGARPGWWFSGDLPEVPPTSGIPGPVAGASAEAIVSYTDTAPGGDSSITEVTRVPFTFRGPTVARVESPDGDATFTPGERIRVFGHLLATYRVRFALAQTSGGTATTLARLAAPTDEPATGAYTATLDDVMVQGDVPPDAAAVVGPAQVVATPGLAGVDVAGSPSGMEVVPKTCDREHEHLVPGSEDSCEPYSGRLHDRYYADTTADPFCRHLLEDTTTCVYGCSTGGVNHVALAFLDVRNAACVSHDPDFGNPYEVGSFGGEVDRCEGDILIEVVPPSASGGPHRSIVCSHGCSAGACNCPATPVPITVGCLPFDWPVPPAGEEALYGRVFSAACRERVADFAYASGLDGTRCYRVVPMWFPEHWSDHPRWIGSDGSSPGNPSWPHRRLDTYLVVEFHRYWTDARDAAVAAGCTGESAYLCDYRDVNVWLGLTAWRWGDYGNCTPGACGSAGFFGELYPAALAAPRSVPHELGHVFGWMESASGRWHMLCEEYDRCAFVHQAMTVSCGNGSPPSQGSGLGWAEEDSTCRLISLVTCEDGTWGNYTDCLGAPLAFGVSSSRNAADHCIMGLGTVGFCSRCRAFLEDAFTRWEPQR